MIRCVILTVLLVLLCACETKDYCAYSSCVDMEGDEDMSVDIASGRCGDGTVQLELGEQCEIDEFNSSQTCLYGESSCSYCSSDCKFLPGKVLGYCGDGKIQSESGEQCDHGGLPGKVCEYGQRSCEVCNEACKIVQGEIFGYCGDGKVQDAESCDGNLDAVYSCLDVGKAIGSPMCEMGACNIDYSQCQSVDGVSAGYLHTCALVEGGLKCWGGNGYGALGDGSTDTSLIPVDVVSLDGKVVDVTAGDNFTCAVMELGNVKCWGWGGSGQLGNGLKSPDLKQPTPSLVPGLFGVKDIDAKHWHVCAALTNGGVKCWGDNDVGQLGDGTNVDQVSPAGVKDLVGVDSISVGGFHSCVKLNDNTVKCWGAGSSGQLGRGTRDNALSPVSVSGLSNVVSISSGFIHSCSLLNDNTVKCWGSSSKGQLGNGSNATQNSPVNVLGINDAIGIAAGKYHTCALIRGGIVKCWGEGIYGQLGYGNSQSTNVPVVVKNIENAVAVTAGERHTCAVLSTGDVQCWGQGYQLGNGKIENQLEPMSVVLWD